MSALGRSIDNDSAALKSHFFMAFGNLLKDEDTSQKASTKNKYSRVYLDVHITAKPTDYCQNKAYFGQLWPIIGI